MRIPSKLKPADFQVRIPERDKPVTVRVINLIVGPVTIEEQIPMTPKDGLLEIKLEKDILKVAFIDRAKNEGKMFTGFVKGIGIKGGLLTRAFPWGYPGLRLGLMMRTWQVL